VTIPIVCTLSPETVATRKANLLPGLVQKAQSREVLADGFRFQFAAETWPALMQTIDAERRCCRFLRFEIIVEPDGGPVCVSVTGPPGTREFLSALFDA
jgi:hypothetical protein